MGIKKTEERSRSWEARKNIPSRETSKAEGKEWCYMSKVGQTLCSYVSL